MIACIADQILADETAERNRNALVRVLEETGQGLRPAEFAKWRPTKRVRGEVVGIPVGVECVATDGNLTIFVTLSESRLGRSFIGHTQRFEWTDEGGEQKTGTPPTLFGLPKVVAEKQPRKERAPARKAQILASL